MVPRLLLAALILVPAGLLLGCGSMAGPTSKLMPFATVQALNPGVEGEWILSEYPFARQVQRRSDGSLQSMGYWVDDPLGRTRPLMLHFNADGVLVRKEYGGPLERPPQPGDTNGLTFGG